MLDLVIFFIHGLAHTYLLLGVEVVVGEPRSHTSCTRYTLLLDILLSDMRFQALQEYTKANI